MTMGDNALRDRLLSMTQDEITALWREQQAAAKAAGRPYYKRCVNVVTGEVTRTFEEG